MKRLWWVKPSVLETGRPACYLLGFTRCRPKERKDHFVPPGALCDKHGDISAQHWMLDFHASLFSRHSTSVW